MALKRRGNKNTGKVNKTHGVIEGAGDVVEQQIVTTLEKNYMPYAMSVILSRAIPEIDGFKPSHRKLLYTMYKMGLLGSVRTKSANIVGQTMKLNPHGDSAIYDTMVRLSRGYEALLHPYIDSKGNFGKFYSRDMASAASRYTEARLDDLCYELFRDIDKDTVDFVPNYDNTLKEPTLLPTVFPSILVNANTGIAVGMASSICSFNLNEVCHAAVNLIENENCDLEDILIAPDFPGGGSIIYDKKAIREIYKTGRGGIKVRGRYDYDKESNCIDIMSIPPTTTSEAIIEKIIELVKKGFLKEISDIRDETGIDGLKITIDLKRGTDPAKLMQKVYRQTPLEDTFSCNFNILVNGVPKVMGVKEILNEWISFRVGCVKRRTAFDLKRKKDRLHLLLGLKKILLDIDKAVKIIRETKEEAQVVPNLMDGFSIDEVQAEYVAEIKLRHLNREYIVKRTNDIKALKDDIEKLEQILRKDCKVKEIIKSELSEVAKKYGKPRRTMIIYKDQIEDNEEVEEIPNYPVNLFFTKNGYFKKITPQSLRMSGEQKLKEGDKIIQKVESSNKADLLFFTDKCHVYKSKVSEFQDSKASVLGDYVKAQLNIGQDEDIIYMAVTEDYSGFMLFFFENGKVAKLSMKAYATKTNRKKLVNVYSNKFPLVYICYENKDKEYLITSSKEKLLIVNSGALQVKTTKDTMGVAVMTLKKGQTVKDVHEYKPGELIKSDRYRTKNLPAVGSSLSREELESKQMTL